MEKTEKKPINEELYWFLNNLGLADYYYKLVDKGWDTMDKIKINHLENESSIDNIILDKKDRELFTTELEGLITNDVLNANRRNMYINFHKNAYSDFTEDNGVISVALESLEFIISIDVARTPQNAQYNYKTFNHTIKLTSPFGKKYRIFSVLKSKSDNADREVEYYDYYPLPFNEKIIIDQSIHRFDFQHDYMYIYIQEINNGLNAVTFEFVRMNHNSLIANIKRISKNLADKSISYEDYLLSDGFIYNKYLYVLKVQIFIQDITKLFELFYDVWTKYDAEIISSLPTRTSNRTNILQMEKNLKIELNSNESYYISIASAETVIKMKQVYNNLHHATISNKQGNTIKMISFLIDNSYYEYLIGIDDDILCVY